MSSTNGNPGTSLRLKTGLAEMLKGGVIMDVTDAEQATIAEKSGAVAVMALERVPAQIRAEGGVALSLGVISEGISGVIPGPERSEGARNP